MRLAKVADIGTSEKEHQELVEKIPVEIKKAYSELVHTIQLRQDKVVQKKLNFLERRAHRILEKQLGLEIGVGEGSYRYP